MVEDLVQWLREQFDDDERIARAARDIEFCKDGRWIAKGPFEEGFGSIHSEAGEAILGEEESVPFAIAGHAARYDPDRVLREIDAKRQVVKLHGRATLRAGGGAQYYDTTTVCRSCEPNYQFPELSWPCTTLRLLALPYADRPGYREEWRP